MNILSEPLWRRGLRAKAKSIFAASNRGALARLDLFMLLKRCGADVSLVEIHTWTRGTQGQAYLWAIDFLNGRENIPYPWKE